MEALLAILIALGLAWFWSDSLKARERALQICANACLQMDVQLLDETVAVARLGMGRNGDGRLALRRYYVFEFSIDGTRRWRGRAVLLGRAVEMVQLDHPDGTTILEQGKVYRLQ